MQKSIIIGLGGKIGSGKSTLAEELAKTIEHPIECHAFGDNLKAVVGTLVGRPMQILNKAGQPFYNEIWGYTQEEKNLYLESWGMTIGELLQTIGTQIFRNCFDENVWVKSLFETKGYDAIKRNNILIIPDVRFINEAEFIRNKGGILIRLDGDPNNVRKNSTRKLDDESEVQLDKWNWDYRLVNNTLVDLRNELKLIINELGLS